MRNKVKYVHPSCIGVGDEIRVHSRLGDVTRITSGKVARVEGLPGGITACYSAENIPILMWERGDTAKIHVELVKAYEPLPAPLFKM